MSKITEPTEPPHAGNIEDWLKWAETKVALSLAVSLYFKAPRAPAAEGVLECYREYLELCEPHLRWYANDNGTYRKPSPKVLRIPFQRVPEVLEHGKFWAWLACGGQHHRHAAPHQFYSVLTDGEDTLSHVRAAFPVEMFIDEPERFVALVRRFAERVPFFFGYAGFSFSESMEIATKQTNEQYLIPAAMRFSGVEVEADATTRLCCQDGLKGVSWLTLLSSSLLERIGGKTALRSKLSEGIALHDLPRGLVVQAGPAPELGDVNAGDRLPLSREVHRALAPIRVIDHWLFGGRFFLQQETRRWLSRFDD